MLCSEYDSGELQLMPAIDTTGQPPEPEPEPEPEQPVVVVRISAKGGKLGINFGEGGSSWPMISSINHEAQAMAAAVAQVRTTWLYRLHECATMHFVIQK